MSKYIVHAISSLDIVADPDQLLCFCSNPEKLRDFIKAVYVDRRYTGDRALPPKGRQVGFLMTSVYHWCGGTLVSGKCLCSLTVIHRMSVDVSYRCRELNSHEVNNTKTLEFHLSPGRPRR